MKSWLRNHWPDLTLILALLVVALYITFPVWRTDFTGGTDYLGHIYKGRFLADMWRQYGLIYPLWSSTWYAGYSFLQLYSPLIYFPLALGSFFLHNDALAGKLLIVSAYMFSGLAMYLGINRLFSNRLAAFIASIAFLIYPFRAAQSTLAGNLPFMAAIAIAPLFLSAYIDAAETVSLRKAAKAAFFGALMLLTHLNTFFLFGLLIALYSVWRFAFKKKGENRYIILFDQIRTLIETAFLTVVFSAWWLVPFAIQSRGVLLNEYSAAVIKSTSITNPISFLTPNSTDFYFSPFIGLAMLIIPILALIFTPIRRNRLAMFFFGASAISLLLSTSLTAGLLAGLPFGGLVVPIRMLYIAAVAFPIIFGVSISALAKRLTKPAAVNYNRSVTVILVILCLVAVWPVAVDTRAHFAISYSIPKEYQEYLNYAKNHDLKGRVLEVDPPWNTYVYAPAKTGQETLGGWYIEGSVIRDSIAQIAGSLSSADVPNDLARLFDAFDTRYILGPNDSIGLEKLTQTKLFNIIWKNGGFTLLRLKDSHGPIREKTPVLLVSKAPADQYMQMAQLAADNDFVFTLAKSENLDQYFDAAELSRFPIIFLYNYNYTNSDIEHSVFKEYMEQGGTLIVTPDGSPDARPNDPHSIFGSNVSLTEEYGPVDWSVTKAGDRSGVFRDIDFSKFAEAAWENKPWAYSVFDNIKSQITVNEKTVLGEKSIGRGKLVLLGFNLPYHVAYTRNSEESKLLGSVINDSMPSTGTIKKAAMTKKPYGEIHATVTTGSTKPVWITISETYMNGWIVTANGKEIEVFKASPPLMLMRLSGSRKYTILAKYKPTAWHYIGSLVSAAGLLILFIFLRRTRPGKRRPLFVWHP